MATSRIEGIGSGPPRAHGTADGMAPRARARLLVVEDDGEMRAVLEDYLALSGFDVESVSDAVAALERLRKQPFDLVVSDLSLPVGSGLSLLRSLRDETSDPPAFIVITAFGEWTSYSEALSLGVSAYLTKPFGMEELVQKIRAALPPAP